MQKYLSIAKTISLRVQRAFFLTTIVQLFIICIVMTYLSYKDANSRANFLAMSNSKSLGLMISTGDIFQLKNVVTSFRSEMTPTSWIIDEQGRNVLEDVDNSKVPFKIRFYDKNIFVIDASLALLTRHEIKYNDAVCGYLMLVNKIQFNDWLLVCFILTLFAIAAFFIQGKFLEKQSLSVGRHIAELGFFFDHTSSEETLRKFFCRRGNSNIEEIESLASKIKEMLAKLISTATIEKEAAIGRIISQLSHDLRAPLNSIERLLHLPQNTTLNSQNNNIRESLYRLNSMIESLRQSDLELMIKPKCCRLDFKTGLLGIEAKAVGKSLVLFQPTHCLDSHFRVDPLKFERSWINLASNALDFAKTYVKVETKIENTDLILRVIDDGPGIPEDFLPQLFQRGATHGKADGTGLGLAYVRQIMRGHGGDVTYHRENGLTIFECRIPHAVIETQGASMEIQDLAGSEAVKASIKKVSVCMIPDSLGDPIFAHLTSLKTENFIFSRDYRDADIVITNDEDLLLKALAENKNPLEVDLTLPMEKTLMRLARRFN